MKLGKKQTISLTQLQKDILLIELIATGESVWNLAYCSDLFEYTAARQAKLELTLNRIWAGNDSLRLRLCFFELDEELPYRAYISDTLTVAVEEVKSDSYEQAKEWLRVKTAEPFLLFDAPLYYFAIIRIPDGSALFYGKFHHILADGYTMNETAKCLKKALFEDTEPTVPATAYGNNDYIEECELYEVSDEKETDRKFFRNHFSELKNSASCADGNQYDFDQESECFVIEIDDETTAGLKTICDEHNFTPFQCTLAIWQIMTMKLAGTTTPLLHVPYHNRTGKRKGAMGMYVVNVPFIQKLDGTETIGELIRKNLRLMKKLMLRHSRLPYAEILQLFRETTGERQIPKIILSDVGGASDGRRIYSRHSAVELDISVNAGVKGDEGLRLVECVYQKSRYSGPRIEVITNTFQNIARQIADDSKTRSENIRALTEEEYNRIVYGWNETEKKYPRDKTILQLFEEQTKKTPENTAVVYEDKQLTYRALNQKANQIARMLPAMYARQNERVKNQQNPAAGAGHPEAEQSLRDRLVAICIDRGLEMITGIMGIMKSGAAYVPIEPDEALERFLHKLDDTDTRIILTDTKNKGKLTEILREANKTDRITLLCIDDEQSDLADQDDSNPANNGQADDLAYVIYTSGSTGIPKGVMIEHRSLINYCYGQIEALGINAADRSGLYANYTFDTSVGSIFPFLAVGAAIDVISEEKRYDFSLLNKHIETNKITIIDLPTQAQEIFVEKCDNKALNYLLTGGEKLNRFVERSYTQVNEYGPTESTIIATSFKVDKYYENIPIGKPTANSKCYILDEHLNPVAVGVTGELHIGGTVLARGYLNNSELTAEKFISDPFIRKPQTNGPRPRMYKTGDLCRYMPDGNIEYIGRKDFQVKLRGYRVELGEIEAVLQGYAGIRNAVVAAREKYGSKYLVGYYTINDELQSHFHRDTTAVQQKPDEQLYNYLHGKLPEYMIPAQLVCLDEMPLNSNGKIERSRLPEVEFAGNRNEYVAARNETEQQLVNIWSVLLNSTAEEIGIKDDFFNLGGDSLKIIIMLGKIRSMMNKTVSATAVFAEPTIENIAKLIAKADNAFQPLVKFNIEGPGTPLFFVHGGEGGAEGYLNNLVRQLDQKVPLYLIDNYYRHEIGPEWYEKEIRIEDAAERYLEFVRNEQPQGPYQIGGWSFGGMVALEMARLLTAAGETVQTVYMIDAHATEQTGTTRLYREWPKPVYDGLVIYFKCTGTAGWEGIAQELIAEFVAKYPLNGYEKQLVNVEIMELACGHYDITEQQHMLKIVEVIAKHTNSRVH